MTALDAAADNRPRKQSDNLSHEGLARAAEQHLPGKTALERRNAADTRSVCDTARSFQERPTYDNLIALHQQVNEINSRTDRARAAAVSAIVNDADQPGLFTLSTQGKLSVLPAIKQLLRQQSGQMGEQDGARFMQDINTFAQRPEVQTDRIERTLESIAQMLEKPSSIEMTDEHKLLAAKGFAYHLADLGSLWIGNHFTCNVTALEDVLLARFPDIAADMLSSAVRTGRWTSPDGATINANPDSFNVPGTEEKSFPPDDGSRTFDSKILVHVLMNDIGQHLPEPERMIYWEESGPKAENTKPGPAYWVDSQNKKLDYYGEVFNQHSCVPAWLLGAELHRLTGEKDAIIADSEVYKREHSDAHPRWKNAHKNSHDKVLPVPEKQLGSYLSERKSKGTLPIVVTVSSVMLDNLLPDEKGHRLKRNKFGRVEKPLKTFGNHYVTVVDYDPVNQQVNLKNNWARHYKEGWISLNEFKDLMRPKHASSRRR